MPAIGATAFWHKGTYFRFHRKKESVVNSHPWGGAIKDSEEIKISCFGRSTGKKSNHSIIDLLVSGLLTLMQIQSTGCSRMLKLFTI